VSFDIVSEEKEENKISEINEYIHEECEYEEEKDEKI